MIEEPVSRLGRYLVRNWERVSLVGGESLVYWLRKLIFRGAWLDHQVKRGALEVVWDDDEAEFAYQHPGGGGRPLLELAPVPSLARAPVPAVAAGGGRRRTSPRCSRSTTTPNYHEQLALGVLTGWCCSPRSRASRSSGARRRSASSSFATIGEVTGSLIWGVYHYRLHNLPLFVPPAHGLVYLTGLSLALALRAAHARARRDGRGRGGDLGRARPARAAAARRRRRDRRAAAARCSSGAAATARSTPAVFLVVAALELYGTAIGTWRWARELPGPRHPGRQPAVAASRRGYVWFDVMALLVAPYLIDLRRRRLVGER